MLDADVSLHSDKTAGIVHARKGWAWSPESLNLKLLSQPGQVSSALPGGDSVSPFSFSFFSTVRHPQTLVSCH